MKTITLRNEFHNTETTVELLENGHVSPDSIDRAGRELCGMGECTCQSVKMNGYSVVDIQGDLYEVD